ncbi:MAG: DUF2062 domain-containing protein [Bacteroidetes bacterium]|nr:DUF2062 domain-containing protein [Bacteroidota bacterium]
MKRIRNKIKYFFSMGLSPREIAISSTIAAMYSIIPFFGVSKIMTTITGLKLKYNLPLMYTVGYLVYPLQFLLFLPFLRLGEKVMGIQESKLVWSEFKIMIDEHLFQAIKQFSAAFGYALLGWIPNQHNPIGFLPLS